MKAALLFVCLASGVIVCGCQVYTEDLLRASNLAASGTGPMANAGAGDAPSTVGGFAAVLDASGGAPRGGAGLATAEAGASGRNDGDGGAADVGGSAGASGAFGVGGAAAASGASGTPAAGGTAAMSGAGGPSGDSGSGNATPACVVAADCDDGNPCTVDLCDAAGTCSSAPGNPGAVCRPAAGPCDIADKCTGTSVACPADAVISNGTACDDSNASTCNDVCTAGTCGGSKSCTPCSGICAKPVNIDNQTNPSTGSALCYERTNATGANAGGVAGKGFEVNGHAVTSDGSVSPWPAKRYGGYCFKSNASLAWLSLY
jgi:hypothetical protein